MVRRILHILLVGVLLMSWAVFEITDGTRANTVNLISDRLGFIVRRWRPAAPAWKGGGVWQDSPLSDGRRPAQYAWANIVESAELLMRARGQDAGYASLRKLRQLVQLASDYWMTNWQDTPVYIRAKARNETQYRYAYLYAGQVPEDPDPHAQPFFKSTCKAVADDMVLTLEHGPWMDKVPGTGTCVAASGTQGFALDAVESVYYPAQSADDAYVFYFGRTISTAGNTMNIGSTSDELYYAGIRFRNVTIPAGTVPIAAYMRFQSSVTSGATIIYSIIRGELNTTPAAFSTYSDFIARTKTTSSKMWTMTQWILNTSYNTVDITDIVAEIFSTSGWASGNDLVLFVEGTFIVQGVRVPYAWDDPAGNAPELHIIYAPTAESTFGRAATCLDEVYIANKHVQAQLTHIYTYDASLVAWSANLIGSAAHALMPTNPVGNLDIIYFGIDTSIANTGPFDNVVYDVGTPAVYTVDAQILYEYWNGGWVTLTGQDNTKSGANWPWDTAGVGSYHFRPPADWATTTVTHPIDGAITGWWIRARAILNAGTISQPTQTNRAIYTCIWPQVSMAATQVSGDMPALLEVRARNVSDNTGVGGISMLAAYTNRLLVGGRKDDRGTDFTIHLNAAATQNPPGMTIANLDPIRTTTRNDPQAPCGIHYYWNPAGAVALTDVLGWDFNTALAPQYFGRFHMYVIGGLIGGTAGDMTAQLALRLGEGWTAKATMWQSDEIVVEQNQWALLDFGVLQFPEHVTVSDLASGMRAVLRLSNTAVAGIGDFYIFSLVFFPVDEFAVDLIDPDPPQGYLGARDGTYPTIHRYILADAIERPKAVIRAPVYDEGSGAIVFTNWRIVGNTLILQADEGQKLWFLAGRYVEGTPDTWQYEPVVDHTIQLWRVQRYYTSRGST